MVMRRKWMVHYPAPDYEERGTPYWYTFKLKHGGVVVNDWEGLKWIEGTCSAWDCVDSRSISIRYLQGLAEQLGYMGSKRFYGMVEGIGLKEVDNEYDLWMVIQRGKGREFTLFLEGSKTEVSDQEKEIEGEVELLQESDKVEDLVDNLRKTVLLKKPRKVKHHQKTSLPHEHTVEDSNLGNQLAIIDLDEVEGSSEDEDYEEKEDSCDDLLDDIIYQENVDLDAEWLGRRLAITGNEEDEESESEGFGDDIHSNESDFDSISSDEDEANREDSIVFRASSVMNPVFRIEQIFSNKTLFKQAVNSYSVKVGHATRFTNNDGRRIYARCKADGCEWHINALKVKNEESFQIRQMDLTHTCPKQYTVDNANSRWLAEKFEKEFRADPKRSVKGFRREATEKLGCYISPFKAYRAKQKALKMIEGECTDQYAKLWDYAGALIEKNPGSTVKLEVDNSPAGNRFKRVYICLHALKQGFKAGCRPWIGVDGCHLRGPSPGVLLTAVSMDPNNDPYPLSYAVVGVENEENWAWFLDLIREDLMGEREDVYAFMSDKQKGLINAFERVIPGVENRFCVRHLHENMKRTGFRGNEFKRLLWKAAKATTVPAFERAMEQIGQLDERCVAWLKHKKHPSEWTRSHFNTFGKCDTLVNNVCEQWNAALLDAREKPVLTMLEWIREYCMSRLQKNRDRCERKWEGQLICPRIRKILIKMIDDSADCIPMKSNEYMYEVNSSDGSRYSIDLLAKSCDCRKWDVNGIPCKHAVRAINCAGKDPEDFVHSCYSVETYQNVYAHHIEPMNGEELWKKTGYIPPLPPNFGKKKAGRPKKARRFDVSVEDSKGKKKLKGGLEKLPKQSFTVTCKHCGERGHNKLGCGLRKAQVASLGSVFPGSTSSAAANNDPKTGEGNQPEELDIQEEYPPLSQDEEAMLREIEEAAKLKSKPAKPTTVEGRRTLARKRSEMGRGLGYKRPNSKLSVAYTMATSLGCPPPVPKGPNIRAPPPMSFMPNSYLGREEPSPSAENECSGMKVIRSKGKKFVTMSSLKKTAEKREKGRIRSEIVGI